MKKVKNLSRKMKIVLVVCILFVLAAGASAVVIAGSLTRNPDLPSSVVISGTTYTNENPLTVLEIVPDAAAGELGYMVGNDESSVSYSDIAALPDNLSFTASDGSTVTKNSILQQWAQIVGGMCGNLSVRMQDSAGNVKWPAEVTSQYSKYTPVLVKNSYWDGSKTVYEFAERNLFAQSVFGSDDMDDKIEIHAVTASKVTDSDLSGADMIYVSSSGHLLANSSITLYNYMVEAAKGTSLASKYAVKTSVQIAQSANNYEKNNTDLSAKNTWKILKSALIDGMPLIYDNNVRGGSGTLTYNVEKMGAVLLGIDADVFIEKFAANYDSDRNAWSGASGNILADNLEIYYGSAKMTWTNDMFQRAFSSTAYPYYNAGTFSTFLSSNVMAYNGDNTVGNSFINGTTYFSYQEGMDYEKIDRLYGDGSGTVANAKLVRYILGDYPTVFNGTINVLEIEPVGNYQYNSDEGRKKILNYFNFSEDSTATINIKTLSSNGFNGLSEDLIQNYDLIIVGTKSDWLNTSYRDTTFAGQIYTAIGDKTTLYSKKAKAKFTARMSGNDLTADAKNRIIDYAQAGYPVLMDYGVYYASDEVSETSNIYQLKDLKKYDNTICQTKAGHSPGNTFEYIAKPTITVTSPADATWTYSSEAVVDYSKWIKADGTSLIDPSNIVFTGTTTGTAGHIYRIDIYIDRNGDGLFVETSDDKNELFVSSTGGPGAFSIATTMPNSTRGYMAWKAVITDTSDGNISGETTGAFVIVSDDVMSINVLQIVPDSNITLDLKGDDFKKYFNSNVTKLTGYELNVTQITFDKWMDIYSKAPYSGDYKDASNYLKQFSMVVVGFADGDTYKEQYGSDDIPNNNHGALDNLKDYIDKGNAVLFTHDTMSISGYSDGNVSTGSDGYQKYDVGTNGKMFFSEFTWKFRNVIGLDRYGVTDGQYGVNADGTVSKNQPTALNGTTYSSMNQLQGYSNGFMSRYGASTSETKIGVELYSNISTASKQTYLNTTTVSKLNNGQVTEYPYAINDQANIAETHNQYFQLDLERENKSTNDQVVVWYTLGNAYEEGNYYGQSGQDAVNNYYIYSKGNVTYSSAGNKQVNGDEELRLFVNTIVKAMSSANSVPTITVDNATKLDTNHYTMYMRNSAVSTLEVQFTAKDLDLKVLTGKFKSARVYVDLDGDEAYDVGEPILLKYDDSDDGALYNAKQYTFDLYSVAANAVVENSLGAYTSLNATALVTEKINANELKLGFEATDNNDATGYTILSFVTRQLFKLN